MKVSSPLKVLIALALILTGAPVFGQSTITQVGSFSNVADPANQTLTFNQFNPSVGTLTKVEIDLTNVFVSGKSTIKNNSGARSSYTIDLVGDYKITDSKGDVVNVSLTTPTYTKNNLASGSSATSPTRTNATAGSGSVIFSTVAALAPYIGTGTTGSTVVLTSANSVTVSAGASPYLATQISTGSGNYDLIYTYTPTPVPEPAQTAGIMIGFAMCLFAGRIYLKNRGDQLS